jgi:hypothetical protein
VSTAYVALTDEEWAAYLQDEDLTSNVNFWSPGAKPLRSNLAGQRLFFFVKTPQDRLGQLRPHRLVAGYGRVVGFELKTAAQAWAAFGPGNGAASLEAMLARISKFGSVGARSAESTIGCTVLDEVYWFPEPVRADQAGIAWAPSIVRGKTISDEQEQRLLEAAHLAPGDLPSVLQRLATEFAQAPPRRKETVSKRIERNPLVVGYLKRLHDRNCQYCGTEFFVKRGGRARYSEVHHVKELGAGGLDIVDNCLVLCATCHRRFHYGELRVEATRDAFEILEAGAVRRIARNRLPR